MSLSMEHCLVLPFARVQQVKGYGSRIIRRIRSRQLPDLVDSAVWTDLSGSMAAIFVDLVAASRRPPDLERALRRRSDRRPPLRGIRSGTRPRTCSSRGAASGGPGRAEQISQSRGKDLGLSSMPSLPLILIRARGSLGAVLRTTRSGGWFERYLAQGRTTAARVFIDPEAAGCLLRNRGRT